MEQYNNPPIFNDLPVMPLPNATPVLILGILSIPFCCGYGIIGLILAIIALVLAKKDERLYRMNPSGYTVNSYKNLRAGRVCAIIGVVMSSLYLVFFIIALITFGVAVITNPSALSQSLQNLH